MPARSLLPLALSLMLCVLPAGGAAYYSGVRPNYSAVDAASGPLGIVVSTDGVTITITWPVAMTRGAGWSGSNINVDGTDAGDNIAWAYTSGDGSATWVGSISGATILQGATVDLDFDGSANAVEYGAGTDAAAFANVPAVNNSTQTGDITSGLVGWWKMNEGTGTSVADASGNGNGGTLTGGVTWSTGPTGNGAVTFDGTDDYIAIANEASFDFERTQAFSVSMWVRWNASATGNDYVFSKQSTSGNQPGIEMKIDADNARRKSDLVNGSGATIGVVTSVNSLTSGVWHHIVLTYDGSSNGSGLSSYIDNGTPATGTGTLTGSILNDNPAWIARSGTTYYFGEIDDVRFYNRQLSGAEVTTLYTGGAK